MQALVDDFESGDTDGNGTLNLQEARELFLSLTRAEFDALDADDDGELTQEELEAAGAEPPRTGGCNGCRKSRKVFSDLKDFFGDLFLLGLLAIVLVAWPGFKLRPEG